MMLLISLGYEFFQIDTANVTRQLLDKITEGDAIVFRVNPTTGVFEKFNEDNETYEPVDEYTDEEDDEDKARNKLASKLYSNK